MENRKIILEWWNKKFIFFRKQLAEKYFPDVDFTLIDKSPDKIEEIYNKLMDELNFFKNK